MMNLDPAPFLDDLENRIDPEVEPELLNQWKDFIHGRFRGDHYIDIAMGMEGVHAVNWDLSFRNLPQ